MYKGVSSGVRRSLRVTVWSVVCLVVLWAGAVAAETQANGSAAALDVAQGEEKLLKTRVLEYWAYKGKKDFEKSYLYETPEYREKVKEADYVKSFGPGVDWLGATVSSVQITGDQATVWVKVEYKWAMIPVNKKMTGSAKEEWRKIDNTWFHVKKEKNQLKSTEAKLKEQLENSKGGGKEDSVDNKVED